MTPRERLFAGIYPCGISYADRGHTESGDYAPLAFLAYKTLELTFVPGCPREMRELIAADAEKIQARRGELFQISTCGQTVRLGGIDAAPASQRRAS